jgi:hypothetical protein
VSTAAQRSAALLELSYLLEDEAEPLGLLDAADPPLMPPPLLLADDPPDPPLDIAPLLVPPVEPELVSLPELAEELGALGVALDEDDEPPGTTTVFSLVEDEAEPLGVALPPGTTVVVSFRSHAENANALTKITMQLPSFLSTLFSSDVSLQDATPG